MRTKFKDRPWKLTFSYGRALQEDALLNWAKKGLLKGKETTEKCRKDAQDALIYRARMNHLASMGEMK